MGYSVVYYNRGRGLCPGFRFFGRFPEADLSDIRNRYGEA